MREGSQEAFIENLIMEVMEKDGGRGIRKFK